MSLSSTTLFGGAVIFGTIGLIWNKIKFILSRILNLFIVTVKIDGDIPQAMQIYLINNFKKFPFQPLSFSTFHNYIKSTKKRCIIGYKELNLEDKIIFWKNWKPLIISSNKNNNSPTSPSNSSNNIKTTLSFIRGTFNINNLIIEALELLNIKKIKNDKISRFMIYTHFSKNNKSENYSKQILKTEETGYFFDKDIFLGDKKILKYDINVI